VARKNYREGTWFAVPLPGGGYALGIVARANPKGVLVGYFFAQRNPVVPSLDGVSTASPTECYLGHQVWDLGYAGKNNHQCCLDCPLGLALTGTAPMAPCLSLAATRSLSGRAFKVFMLTMNRSVQ